MNSAFERAIEFERSIVWSVAQGAEARIERCSEVRSHAPPISLQHNYASHAESAASGSGPSHNPLRDTA